MTVSAGSLGNGLPIGIGMALVDSNRDIYALVSDGEVAEGSIWESIRIMNDYEIKNLKLYVNWNGYGAYSESSRWAYATLLQHSFIEFRKTSVSFPFSIGQDSHYHVLTKEEYEALS